MTTPTYDLCDVCRRKAFLLVCMPDGTDSGEVDWLCMDCVQEQSTRAAAEAAGGKR